MRKILLLLFALVILTTVVSTATAQNVINLGASSITMTFTGDGSGNWSLVFNGTGGTLSGSAFGTGTLSSGPDPYSITQGTGISAITITGTFIGIVKGADTWSIAQSGPLAFSYGPGLLSGNLQLVNLGQTGTQGNFNDQLVANLTNLGGTLLGDFTSAGAIATITVDFASSTDLSKLLSGGTLNATIGSGAIYPTPEPGSMALVGSGLVLLGGLVRRRRKA